MDGDEKETVPPALDVIPANEEDSEDSGELSKPILIASRDHLQPVTVTPQNTPETESPKVGFSPALGQRVIESTFEESESDEGGNIIWGESLPQEGLSTPDLDEITRMMKKTFIQELPGCVQRRLMAVRALQAQYDCIHEAYEEELKRLTKKYEDRYRPILERRDLVISGDADLLPSELEGTIFSAADASLDDVGVRGIPGFWLRVLKMCPDVAEDISERDEEVLQYLERIFYEILEDGISFRLSFLFRKNRFFRNRLLTKTYFLENNHELVLKESLGTKIEWSSPSTNVTMTMVGSGRRNRGGKPKMVETESFFHFFEPPNTDTLDDEDAGEEEIAALEMEMEADLELGQVFREKIIPLAFRFYGGEMGTTEESEFDSDHDEDSDDSEGEVRAAKVAFQPFVVKGPPPHPRRK